MEGEDLPTARIRVETTGEARFRAGALAGERERRPPCRETKGNASDIFGRLFLDADQGMAFRLGFDCAEGFAVHEERIIGFAGFERELADCHTTSGGKIDG